MFRLNMSWQVIFLIKWFITFVTRITNVSWTDSNGLFNCVPICFVHVWQNWELQYAYLIETFHPLPLLTSSSIATWFSESCTLPLLTSSSILTWFSCFNVWIEYVFISYLLDDQIIYHICHKNTEFFMFRLNMSWQVIFLIKWFITFVTRITNVSWTDFACLFNCVPICYIHDWQNWELCFFNWNFPPS